MWIATETTHTHKFMFFFSVTFISSFMAGATQPPTTMPNQEQREASLCEIFLV